MSQNSQPFHSWPQVPENGTDEETEPDEVDIGFEPINLNTLSAEVHDLAEQETMEEVNPGGY